MPPALQTISRNQYAPFLEEGNMPHPARIFNLLIVRHSFVAPPAVHGMRFVNQATGLSRMSPKGTCFRASSLICYSAPGAVPRCGGCIICMERSFAALPPAQDASARVLGIIEVASRRAGDWTRVRRRQTAGYRAELNALCGGPAASFVVGQWLPLARRSASRVVEPARRGVGF